LELHLAFIGQQAYLFSIVMTKNLAEKFIQPLLFILKNWVCKNIRQEILSQTKIAQLGRQHWGHFALFCRALPQPS
jgi:hypothetical protein